MEVLASAVLNRRPLDYLACHTLTEWALKGGVLPNYEENPVDPEFSRQIVSENLAKFVGQKLADERANMIFCAHTIVMLTSINDQIKRVEETYKKEQTSDRFENKGQKAGMGGPS